MALLLYSPITFLPGSVRCSSALCLFPSFSPHLTSTEESPTITSNEEQSPSSEASNLRVMAPQKRWTLRLSRDRDSSWRRKIGNDSCLSAYMWDVCVNMCTSVLEMCVWLHLTWVCSSDGMYLVLSLPTYQCFLKGETNHFKWSDVTPSNRRSLCVIRNWQK